MIKGYYFSQLQPYNFGPRKKVLAQINAFKKSGIDIELIEAPVDETSLFRKNAIIRKIVGFIPYTYIYSSYVWDDRFLYADFYYIRCMVGDWQFTRFLKKLKKKNPSAKIILEFPDFPATYFMTVSLLYKFLFFPNLVKDYFAHWKYHRYVDRAAMLEDFNEVYKIPVIRFMNGIDLEIVKKKNPSGTSDIKMIAVASMRPFHGYDRMIKGLYEYYSNGGTRKIELHLVGGDDKSITEIPLYKELVQQYQLQERIFFYGVKHGDQLNEIYDNCNLAIGSLAMFRYGYFDHASSLKTREYMAKGIPFIAGNRMDVITEKEFPYFLQFENNDTPIDIFRIISFFDTVYQKSEIEVISEIREYAEKHCGMEETMRDVIQYIKGE